MHHIAFLPAMCKGCSFCISLPTVVFIFFHNNHPSRYEIISHWGFVFHFMFSHTSCPCMCLLFIQQIFIEYLYWPGPVLSTWDMLLNKTDKCSCLHVAYFLILSLAKTSGQFSVIFLDHSATFSSVDPPLSFFLLPFTIPCSLGFPSSSLEIPLQSSLIVSWLLKVHGLVLGLLFSTFAHSLVILSHLMASILLYIYI